MESRPTPVPARGRGLRRLARYAAAAAALALVLLAAVYAAARVYLPALVASTADVEARLTELARYPVRVGAAQIDWDGVRPGVRLSAVTVGDAAQPGVYVDELHASVAVLPLLWGRVEFRRLVLLHPRLGLERMADGRLGISGLAPRRGGDPGDGVGWLLSQPHVVVREGELHWRDVRDPNAPLALARIELSLRNVGDRHRLAATAAFPEALCRHCSVSADVYGVPFAGPWDGEIAVRVQGLEFGNLPLALRERLPAALHGRLDAGLRGEWRDGRVRAVRGDVAGKRLRLAFEAQPPFAVQRLVADVAWEAAGSGWRLELSGLTLGLTGAPWRAGRLRLEHSQARSRLEVEHIRLGDVTRFVQPHRARHPWLAHWSELRPSGALDEVRVQVADALEAPRDYAVRARLDDFATAAHERLPSVRGVSGRVAFDADGGTLDLDASGLAFHLPAVFRAPLETTHASGAVRWRRTDAAWHVTGTDLRVRGEDGHGTGTLALEVPHDASRSPVLDLRVDFGDGNGAHAARYYPVHKLPPHVLAWMESAFVAGRITSGHLIYDGPIRAFPFQRDDGRFEIRAQVRDGVYRYLPGWAPLTQVEASVAVDGADAVITGRGRIGALAARDVRVAVARAKDAPGRAVRVTGTVEGPVAETVRVLQAAESGPAPAWGAPVGRITNASGDGRLDLDVRVPLKSERGPSFLAAYRFEDAALELGAGARLEAAAGSVRLSETGLQEGRLQARLFGGPLAVVAARVSGELRLHAEGTAFVSELLRRWPAIARRADGSFDWSLSWNARAGRPRVRFESDLSRIRTRLPPPLDRPQGGIAGRLTVTTQASRADELALAVDGGPGVSGALRLRREAEGWRFDKGRLDIGRAAGRMPAAEGLALGLGIDALDADRWLPLLRRADGGVPLERLAGVSARVGRLTMLERQWGQVFVHLVNHRGEWRAVLDGDAAAGEATLAWGGDAARVRLDLAYLRLAPRLHDAAASRAAADPRRLPALDLEARSFEYQQRRFGELSLRATPHRQGWRIERLSLARPEGTLSVAGNWRRRGERDLSDLSLELRSRDLGVTLDAWGVRGQIAGGNVTLQAELSWPGTPTQPTLAGLDGRVELAAEKGRFLRLDPGAARLFGLLDLRAIGRYLTLDFTPAFGKGFVFDAIHGKIAIERGNASTDSLIVSGPSLSLHARGRVGLAAEDYDMALEVSPRIGDTLTLTTWGLFGPQAAAAVLALKQLFRRQIQEGTRITYIVKGPWDQPDVTRLPKEAPEGGLPGPTP